MLNDMFRIFFTFVYTCPPTIPQSRLYARVMFMPHDAIWRRGSRWGLVRVVSCCLTVPCHYLKRCWLGSQYFLAATKQLIEHFFLSVCLAVRLSHLFHYVPIIVSSRNFQELLPLADVMSMQKVKVSGQRSRSHGTKIRRFWPKLGVSGLKLQFEFTIGYEMMHKAWSRLGEVPYCFSTSSVKFQGRTALKIAEFDPDLPFPACNSSLNSPMATKWCTKLEIA